MSALYDRLAARTLRLIAKYGRDITIIKTSRTAEETAKPWRGPARTATDTSATVKAVIFDDVAAAGLGTDLTAALIRRGAVGVVLIAATATTADLATFDVVSDGGRLRSVSSVEVLKPGDTSLLYIMGLSK